MKIRILVYTFVILLIATLQCTLLEYVRVFGVKPNLILIFTISVALLRGNVEGAAVGFFAGLSQDMLTGKVLGVYALLGLYLGLLIGSVNKRLYRENILVIIFFSFVSTAAYEFVIYAAGVLLPALLSGAPESAYISHALRGIILYEAIYNSVVAIFVYLLVIRLNRRFEANNATRKY